MELTKRIEIECENSKRGERKNGIRESKPKKSREKMRMNHRERKQKRDKKMVQFSLNISVAKVDGPTIHGLVTLASHCPEISSISSETLVNFFYFQLHCLESNETILYFFLIFKFYTRV